MRAWMSNGGGLVGRFEIAAPPFFVLPPSSCFGSSWKKERTRFDWTHATQPTPWSGLSMSGRYTLRSWRGRGREAVGRAGARLSMVQGIGLCAEGERRS